jgi:hypothetical protein
LQDGDPSLSKWTLSTNQFGRWVGGGVGGGGVCWAVPAGRAHAQQLRQAPGRARRRHATTPRRLPLPGCGCRDWEFSWLSRNLAPIKGQKLHWVSVSGGSSLPGVNVNNRGQIRFVRKGAAACAVTLTISYEVPDVLAPFANVSGASPEAAATGWCGLRGARA